jgi:hypothetical protein
MTAGWRRRVALAGTMAAALIAPGAAHAAAPPVATILTHPPQYTQDGTATFTFDGGGGTAICLLDAPDFYLTDDGRWDTGDRCGSTYTVEEGKHTMSVRSRSADGTLGPLTSFTWFVDRTAPVVRLIPSRLPPDQIPAGAPVKIAFATLDNAVPGSEGSPIVSQDCRLDRGAQTGAWVPCPGFEVTYADLAPGNYVFMARATDSVGLTGSSDWFGFEMLAPKVTLRTRSRHRRTTIRKLAIARLPAGGKVQLSCHGRGCRFASRTVKAHAGRADLTKLVRRLQLGTGARLVLRRTAPGHAVTIATVRVTRTGAKLSR